MQASLDSAGFTVRAGSSRLPDFALEVQILEQAEDETFHRIGVFTRTVKLMVEYSLRNPWTGELNRRKEISTEYDVKYGLFVKGLRPFYEAPLVGFETAIKMNIETFIRYLGELEKPVYES